MGSASATGVKMTKITNNPRDFLLLCGDTISPNVIYSLYYLPRNFKLMVVQGTNLSDSEKTSWSEDASLQGRVHFKSDDTVSDIEAADAVVLSDTADKGVSGMATIPFGSPEAIASAVLRLSRTTV